MTVRRVVTAGRDTGDMRSSSRHGLLGEIRTGALDSRTDLTDLLRKCVALGGEAGSARLREWASRELKGYEGGAEVPPYRMVSSLLYLDGATLRGRIRGQQVPHNMLPAEMQARLNEPFPLRHSLAELVELVETTRRQGEEAVKLSPPMPQELVALINHRIEEAERQNTPFPLPGVGPSQVVERVYWALGVTTLAAIIDNVRTTLVELAAEMQAFTSGDSVVPTQDAADQAVDVAVYGKVRHLVVHQVVAQGGDAAVAGRAAVVGDAQPEGRPHRLMWWIAGIAGVIGAVAAVAVLFTH